MSNNFPTSALIRPRHLPRQTQMHWQKHSAYRKLRTRHSRLRLLGNPLLPVILLLIVMALSGCHTQPIQPCVQPTIATVPASSLQQPQQTYSSSVQADLSRWERLLTIGTQKQ